MKAQMNISRTVLLLALGLAGVGSAVFGPLGCTRENPRVTARLNDDASLMGELPIHPLRDRVITSWIDKSKATMSTLYGNDAAIGYARSHAGHEYPQGSVLSLVTWSRQEDPRWFGGSIPQKVQSVEFVTVEAGAEQGISYGYQEFEGVPLKKTAEEKGASPSERAAFLLGQRAAAMP